MVAHYQRSRNQERVDSRCSLKIPRWSPARPLAWPGREPINLPGGQFARVRYAPIAHQIPHRSELTLWPSRPGEFHPEPLTDPDLTLSRHPARATARRLPPSIEYRVPPVAG